MRRHLAEPFDAGVLHGGVGVQAFGDGVGDDGLALLLQQLDQPPLLLHQRVDLRRLAVKKACDATSALPLGGKGNWNRDRVQR